MLVCARIVRAAGTHQAATLIDGLVSLFLRANETLYLVLAWTVTVLWPTCLIGTSMAVLLDSAFYVSFNNKSPIPQAYNYCLPETVERWNHGAQLMTFTGVHYLTYYCLLLVSLLTLILWLCNLRVDCFTVFTLVFLTILLAKSELLTCTPLDAELLKPWPLCSN